MTAVHPAGPLRPANGPLYLLLGGLLALSIGIEVVRDRGWQPYEPASPVLWLRSGPLMQRVSLGFDTLVADAYWMRAVVYYGGERRSTRESTYELLLPLLDLTTTLDPRFRIAYRFGAVFLSEPYPGGPGQPEEAIALLERGLGFDPERWEYAHDIGFIHYWALGDYPKAAEWFRRAGAIEGAPSWLVPLAATTLAGGGDRASSRQLWQELQTNTDEDWLRQTAEHRLAQLDAMDGLDIVNRQLPALAERLGRPIRSWSDLLRAGLIRRVPADPRGTPFDLDAQTGLARLSRQSALWPLPAPPGEGQP